MVMVRVSTLFKEGLSAVYTTAVALYTNNNCLELGLLLDSAKQIHGVWRTGLNIAMPGDEYKKVRAALNGTRAALNGTPEKKR